MRSKFLEIQPLQRTVPRKFVLNESQQTRDPATFIKSHLFAKKEKNM